MFRFYGGNKKMENMATDAWVLWVRFDSRNGAWRSTKVAFWKVGMHFYRSYSTCDAGEVHLHIGLSLSAGEHNMVIIASQKHLSIMPE